MNGKENIINKILADADERCKQIISDAEATAKATVAAAQSAIEADSEALEARLKLAREEYMRNARANAELNARKYRLAAKQQLVTSCYDEAYNRLAAMNAADRLDFIGELIVKYAEQGETVYVTHADSKQVTQLWLDGFDKDLKLGKKLIRADGGIVLEGDGYEKDCTLKSVVRYLREQTEAKVAVKLGVRNE